MRSGTAAPWGFCAALTVVLEMMPLVGDAAPPTEATRSAARGTAPTGKPAAAKDERAGPPSQQFVRVVGNKMMLNGQPFRFVGANLSIMHGPDNRAAAEEVLAGAARDGVRVGRIWALGEGASDAAPWIREHFLFRAGADGWVETAALHLDRVIAAAGRVGMRLIITLSNNWADYGGVPRYLRWSGRWDDGVYGVSDRFYGDAGARVAFRAHVERLLARTNHITGVPYRDDPTIMAWELMNESWIATASGAASRRAWIVEMARLIHRRDPNHLVTPGVSSYRFERERKDWLAICRLPEVDYCDAHLYPEEILRNRDAGVLDKVLDDYVRLGQTIAGKPFVLGEFGIRGDIAPAEATAGDQRRWQGQTRPWWIARILERLRFDGAAGGLIWIYQPARGRDRTHGISVDGAGVDATADALRAVIRDAATALRNDIAAGPGAKVNGEIFDHRGESTLMPLHTAFSGRARAIPFLPVGAPDLARELSVTWDPVTYAEADWEASGTYRGGAIEHAWGGESGWFEYEYLVTSAASAASRGQQGSPLNVRAVSVRARLSSEYPGTVSPPDGASLFEVWLDGARLGTALAPRDDGRGRWVTVRAPVSRLSRDALAPGPHRLRFTVPPGPRAHGLAVYGVLGDKPVPGDEPGFVELRFMTRAPTVAPRSPVSPPPAQ